MKSAKIVPISDNDVGFLTVPQPLPGPIHAARTDRAPAVSASRRLRDSVTGFFRSVMRPSVISLEGAATESSPGSASARTPMSSQAATASFKISRAEIIGRKAQGYLQKPKDNPVTDTSAVPACIRARLSRPWLSRIDRFVSFASNNAIHPNSFAKMNWDWFVIILVIYTAIVVPLELGFSPTWMTSSGFVYFDNFVTAVFWLDFGVSLVTGYMDKWGTLITDKGLILKRYSRHMMLVDFLAIFPFTLFIPRSQATLSSMFKLIRLLRLGRLTKKLDVFAAAKALRIGILLAGFVLLAHTLACMWYFIDLRLLECSRAGTCPSVQGDVWITKFVNAHTDSDGYAVPAANPYVLSLYYMLVTMCTVGYGDLYPANDTERAFIAVTILFTTIVYAIIFGNVAVQIKQFDKSMNRHAEKLAAMKEFFTLHGLPPELLDRTNDYISALWSVTRGIDQRTLLGELPKHVQRDILVATHTELVRKVPAFQMCSKQFLKAIIVNLEHQVCLPKDYIVRQGDIAVSMFFIYKGRVAVIREEQTAFNASSRSGVASDSKSRFELEAGSFFGEAALVSGDVYGRRTTSVQAIELCHLFMLRSHSFQQAIRDFPEYKDLLKDLEARRQEVANLKVQQKSTRSLAASMRSLRAFNNSLRSMRSAVGSVRSIVSTATTATEASSSGASTSFFARSLGIFAARRASLEEAKRKSKRSVASAEGHTQRTGRDWEETGNDDAGRVESRGMSFRTAAGAPTPKSSLAPLRLPPGTPSAHLMGIPSAHVIGTGKVPLRTSVLVSRHRPQPRLSLMQVSMLSAGMARRRARKASCEPILARNPTQASSVGSSTGLSASNSDCSLPEMITAAPSDSTGAGAGSDSGAPKWNVATVALMGARLSQIAKARVARRERDAVAAGSPVPASPQQQAVRGQSLIKGPTVMSMDPLQPLGPLPLHIPSTRRMSRSVPPSIMPFTPSVNRDATLATSRHSKSIKRDQSLGDILIPSHSDKRTVAATLMCKFVRFRLSRFVNVRQYSKAWTIHMIDISPWSRRFRLILKEEKESAASESLPPTAATPAGADPSFAAKLRTTISVFETRIKLNAMELEARLQKMAPQAMAQSWVLHRLLQGMVDGDVTVEDWLSDDISEFIQANPMAVYDPRKVAAEESAQKLRAFPTDM